MLAVQCSFCQHENVPGARFCAECGSPMHLRVCPNPDCGKVSDISEAQCPHCGTAFPKIALAEPDSPQAANPAVSPADAPPPPKKATIAAWPLIIVAVVAGGLPLLWFNRAYLPAPKPWQPEAAKPVGAPLTPPVAVPTPPPPAPMPSPAAPVIEPPPPAQVPAAAVEDIAKPDSPTEQPAEKKPESRPRETKKPKSPKPQPAATVSPESARPCTEAIAALGLCDPKQAGNGNK